MLQIKQLFQSRNQIDYFTKQAAIAALYVALTMLFAPFSFGVIQFRISELLMLFILIDRRYIVGLTLGVFIANLFSPFGVVDLVFGTTATFLALLIYIVFAQRGYQRFILFIATLTLCNAIIIGFELTYLSVFPDFLFSMTTIGIAELILMITAVLFYITTKEKLKQLRIK